MPSESIIELAARVLWDEAENGSGRERYSWDHLTERAATGAGDYGAIRESWLAPARALADAGLLAQQPDAASTVDAYLMPKGWKPSGDMRADVAAADGVLIAGRVMPPFDPDAPTCGDVDGPGGKSRRCLREPGHDGDHANGGRWATAPATEDEVAWLPVPGGPKMLRETLCVAQTCINLAHVGPGRIAHVDRLGRLIAALDVMRPLGPDGKHGDRHTPLCGCEDQQGASR